jgi:nucleotide-binding universal stress UspA family protein
MRLLTLQTVLVATDLHDGSLAALMTARELADAAGAALHVVHVSDKQNALQALTTTLRDAGLPAERTNVHIVEGETPPAIKSLADKIEADAILVGPHRRRHDMNGKRLLGNTALALVKDASVPCMVVGAELRLPLHRVLVGADMRESTRGTLMVALSWTSALRAHDSGDSKCPLLTALHVQRPTDQHTSPSLPKSALDEMLEHLRTDAGTWACTTIESTVADNADAGAAITDYARLHHADMVVLGTSGLRLDNRGRLGSVAAAVTEHLDTPVLLVPPAVWMTYTN